MNFIKTKILSTLLALLIAAGCFAGGMTAYAAESSGDVTVVDLTSASAGGTAAHTCIWSTTYDTANHWEYCTICGAKRNVTAHSYTDHWAKPLGNGSYECTAGNYSVRTCSCGYSYNYRKSHTNSGVYHSTGNRTVHYALCSVCGCWADSGVCYDKNGKELSCQNPGTCVKCGTVIKANTHRFSHGICQVCNKQFYTESEPVIRYNSSYTTATVSFTLTPVNKSTTVLNSFCQYCATPNWTSYSASSSRNSSTGAVTYTIVYQLDSTKSYASTDQFCNGFGVTVNGIDCFVNAGPSYTIYRDHTAPVISDIVQSPQTTVNGWATIQKLTIKGTDNISDTMSIVVTNASGEKICSGTVGVSSKSFTFSTTPQIEGDASGSTYTVTATDRCGNKAIKTFVVKNTDSKPPVYTAATTFNNGWAQVRQVTFTATDAGSGNLQIAFNNVNDFKAATKTGTNTYARTYQFTGDLYQNKEFKVYIKDAIGNITTQTIVIGKLDNTKPNITGLTVSDSFDGSGEANGWKLAAAANDVSTKLSASGSGIAGYAVTSNLTAPLASAYKTAKETFILYSGTYYVWVKDNAGNVSVSDAETIFSDLICNGKHIQGTVYNGSKLGKLYYNGKRIRL